MRTRIYYKPVDARIINGRGRGFAAWLQFTKERIAAAKRAHVEPVCYCCGRNLYDAKTGIQIA